MTLKEPIHHLNSFEWLIIRLLGKFASRIISPDQPTDEMNVDTWHMYRRTNSQSIDIDIANSFWEADRAHREKHRDVSLALNNGTLNIPIRSLQVNDLLCLKIGKEYVELARQTEGWQVYTPSDMMSWDHWLVASGKIS